MVGQGVDINHIDKNGNNGYFQAAKSGQLHILHYLLQNDSILTDVINKDESTPLHYACDQGYNYRVLKGAVAGGRRGFSYF
jgi:ankyrin repeat protein